MCLYGAVLVANCVSYGTTKGSYGAGGYVNHASAIVSNCVIHSNTAGGYGGGGLCINGGLVTHCIITNNTSGNQCGGVRLVNGTLRNSLIVDNRSKSAGAAGTGSGNGGGGGIMITGGTAENCTFYGNSSASATRCDEIYQSNGTVRNCLFCGTDDTAANDVYKIGGTATYCYFRNAVTGTGNITGDPKLANPTAGDYHLAYGSPCIDAGVNIAALTSDLDLKTRPLDGNRDEVAAWDIGCYEYEIDPNAINISFDTDVTLGGNSVTATLTADVVGGFPPYKYVWDFGGGVTKTTTTPTITYTFGYGSHDITLTVLDSKNNSSDPLVRYGLIKVKSSVVYMSPNGSATWPYDTLTKATAQLNDAVGAVYATEAAPGKIWVADGEYTSADAAVYSADLSQPIELVGLNPAIGATFIGAKTVQHRAIKANHARVKVSNLKFKSYYAGTGNDCSILNLIDGVVSNCIFDSSSSIGAGMIVQSGGLLTDCTLSGNNAQTHPGSDRWGAHYITGGISERLVITGCIGGNTSGVRLSGENAVLRNSVIRNNTSNAGAAVYVTAGTVDCCLITNNVSYGITGALGFQSGSAAVVNGANGVVRSCLVIGNRCTASPTTAGALYVASGAAYNNTVWANTLADKTTNDVYVASGTAKNNLAGVFEAADGTADHNWSGFGTKFKDLDHRDFHPCASWKEVLNCGEKMDWMADATDFEGSPRIRHGYPDIGCYERLNRSFTILIKNKK